jgi:hypothetical protein
VSGIKSGRGMMREMRTDFHASRLNPKMTRIFSENGD